MRFCKGCDCWVRDCLASARHWLRRQATMFPLEEGFGEPWFPISTTGLIILLAAVAFGGLAGVLFLGTILEAVAAAGDGDQLGVV